MWAAGDVCGGGGYVWATWWQVVVEVVVWDEEGSRVTVCDARDFWITNARALTLVLALAPKFIPYTIL